MNIWDAWDYTDKTTSLNMMQLLSKGLLRQPHYMPKFIVYSTVQKEMWTVVGKGYLFKAF